MTITKTQDKTKCTLSIEGRLDTTTSPQLEAELKQLDKVTSLVLDFAKLEYISSAGLRTVLMAHKALSSKEGLVVKNLCPAIKEIFDITGFSGIINVQ